MAAPAPDTLTVELGQRLSYLLAPGLGGIGQRSPSVIVVSRDDAYLELQVMSVPNPSSGYHCEILGVGRVADELRIAARSLPPPPGSVVMRAFMPAVVRVRVANAGAPGLRQVVLLDENASEVWRGPLSARG